MDKKVKLKMSIKEIDRLLVVEKVNSKQIKQKEGAVQRCPNVFRRNAGITTANEISEFGKNCLQFFKKGSCYEV